MRGAGGGVRDVAKAFASGMAGQKPCRPQLVRIAVLFGLVARQRHQPNGAEADAGRHHAPTILSFNAASVPILQLALPSEQLSETILFDQATSFIRPQLASVAGAAIPLPYGGEVRQVRQ